MSQGAHFTIDFIEQQNRQSVKMLMDILCIDMKQAYELFHMAGCNTEVRLYQFKGAINLKTNPSPEKHQFSHSISNNNRGRPRRNVVITDFQQQIDEFADHFAHDENFADQFQHFPIARRRPPDRVQQETQFDVKFNRLLQHKKKKKSFESKYMVRKQISSGDTRSIGMKIFDKKPKKLQEKKILNIRPFFKDIQKGIVEKMIKIKFGKGSMSERLQECFIKFQPLLAYHLNFDREENPNTKTQKNSKNKFKQRKMVIDITDDDHQNERMVEVDVSNNEEEILFKINEKNKFFRSLLTDKNFQTVVNDCYLNYIFDVQKYEMESYFKEYFPKSANNQSYLVVLRINYLEEIEFVGKINLEEILQKLKSKDEKGIDEQITNIVNQLKKWSEKCKSIQNQEVKLMERYHLFKQGIYHYEYNKPPSTAQKIKIKEDRQIIKQQQEDFMNMHNQYVEQQIKELEKQGSLKQKISKQNILQKRKIIRQGLQKYNEGDPNIMMVKFRLPSGKNIIVQVSNKEKVAYLFDYIFSHEMQNLGFEQEEEGGCCQRQFDIIRPEDKLGLETKMEVQLEELFEGSLMESVIVKEKS